MDMRPLFLIRELHEPPLILYSLKVSGAESTMQEIACVYPAGNDILQAESIPFADIPGQSALFVQYQNDPASLRRFYPEAVESHTQLAGRIPHVLKNHKADRGLLCDALEEINIKFNAGPKTFEHIAMLRDEDCVAVVTGQQAGLFSGPLYTIYKALSAIKVAECLRGRGYKAVPVFWVATEDHDFEEVSKAFVIDRNGELTEVVSEPSHCYDNMPVGYVKLDESIKASIDELLNSMTPTEFTGELRQMIEGSWAAGTYFGDAFGRLLTQVLDEYGLIILCPLNPKLKELAAPVYVEAIKRSGEIVDALRARSSELENEGYTAQVLIGEDYFPLFWQDPDDTRNALKKTERGTFRTRNGSREFTLEELAEIAANDPIRFSPSVVLRSVVQDYILPTVCYFGGAAEIAYSAQSGEVYRLLGRPATPILHRQSFTFVESKHGKTLDRFELTLPELFAGAESLLPRIAERFLNRETAMLFADVEEKINTQLNRLDQEFSRQDATLAENLAKRRRKIIYHIAALRSKFHHSQVRRDATAQRQIETMFTALLPQRHLQERTLNLSYFLNRYGTNFIDWIYRAVDLDDKGHRVIYL